MHIIRKSVVCAKFLYHLQPFELFPRYEAVKQLNLMDMTKILKVVKPFFVMEAGDTFEYDTNTKQYKSTYSEEHNGSNEGGSEVVSSYNSVYTISEDYAKMLLENGYLEEFTTTDKRFVNIFDEIDNLIINYSQDLDVLLAQVDDTPQCLKVEKETVLRNMIKLLQHLKSLKK